MRDLSKAQFERDLGRLGFTPDQWGYWRLPYPHDHLSVHAPLLVDQDGAKCAPMRRRDALAWFLWRLQKEQEKTR